MRNSRNYVSVASFIFSLNISVQAIGQDNLTWVNNKNITIANQRLTKNDDVKRWWNAGVASQNRLGAGKDGWVSAIIEKPRGARIIGLSSQNTEASWDSVEYGLYVQQNRTIQILENGKVKYTSKIKVSKGDEIKVERIAHRIFYKKNSTIVYRSDQPSGTDLFVDIAMYTPDSQLNNVTVSPSFISNAPTLVAEQNSSNVSGPHRPGKTTKTIPTKVRTNLITGRFKIEQFDPGFINALAKDSNIKHRRIALGKNITQQEFEYLCEKLPWIEQLELRETTNITDFSPLRSLKKLRKLSFDNIYSDGSAPSIDLSPLSSSTELIELALSNAEFSNYDAIKNLAQLEQLELYNVNLSNIDFARELYSLFELKLHPNNASNLRDLSPIVDLPYLETVSLIGSLDNTYTNLSNDMLEPIGELRSIKRLVITDNNTITHLDFIRGKNTLTSLTISVAPKLSKVDAIGTLTQLRNLDLLRTNVHDISMLKPNELFRSVNLNSSPVMDISVFEEFKKLTQVTLNGTQVRAVTSLSNNQDLRYLFIDKSFPQPEIDKLTTVLPDLKVIAQ